MVSIIMLVHNAKYFTKHSILTLSKTKEKFELIVVDNDSDNSTKNMLLSLQKKGYIDKLLFLNQNTLFAKGNNIGSKICSKDSEYILLLNSDIEVRNTAWLDLMLKNHERGATALGVCENNPVTRGDGYCFLIDKDLYLKYELDEEFEWFWSVTKLEALLLNDNFSVKAVKDHENLLHHFGGMSGKDWKNSKGMKIVGPKIIDWYGSKKVTIIEKIDTEKEDDINLGLNLRAKYVINKKDLVKSLKTFVKKIIRRR